MPDALTFDNLIPAAPRRAGLAGSPLGSLISQGEGGYNSVNTGKANGYGSTTADLSSMTVGDILKAQQSGKMGAVGRYQTVNGTLSEASRALGLTGAEKFTPDLQDRIFEQYLAGAKRKPLQDYINGKSNDINAAMLAASQEWASLPNPATGRSYYDGDGVNKSRISVDQLRSTLQATRKVGTEKGRATNASAPTPAAPEALTFDNLIPTQKPSRGLAGMAGDVLAGAVRGAGSIGATILYPIDKAQDLYYGDRDPGVTSLVTGKAPESRNEERRRLMTEALGTLGADTDSLSFKGGRLAGEIAGTAGAGGALANGVRVVAPALAATARGGQILNAIQTAGVGGGAALPVRMVGGAVNGAVSAGMVDPHEAGAGAVIGGALPVVGKAISAVRQAITPAAANPRMLQAARDAAAKGYVIPPSDIQPQGVLTEALGGLSGKIKTAQVASARNQAVTNDLARQALGLPEGAALTPDVLANVRQQAGQAYQAVRGAGQVTSDQAYHDALDKIMAQSQGAERSFPGLAQNPIGDVIGALKRPGFDAGDAVDAVRTLRDMADSAYAKGDKAIGAAYKQASGAVEDMLDRHLSATGQADALKALREARQTIAKTYTLGKAANATTGDVNAQVLAGQLAKGRPLSGELADIAGIASAFPKATQALKEAPKSLSPLDFVGAAAGGLSHPLGYATIAARPAARSLLLSSPMQARAMRDVTPGLLSKALAAGDSETINRAVLLGLLNDGGSN